MPHRTHLAFAGIFVLGTSWMVISGYVLTRPLYAADLVLATGMALVASSAPVLVTVRGGALPDLTAGAVNTALVAATAVLHVRARRRRAALLAATSGRKT